MPQRVKVRIVTTTDVVLTSYMPVPELTQE